MSKSIILTIVSLVYITVFLVVILAIANTAMKAYDEIAADINKTDRRIKNNFYSEDTKVPMGKHIFIRNKTYMAKPGTTFFVDKGNLKLYAEVIYKDNKINLTGQEYHMGGQLIDGSIKDTFIYNAETDSYVNESGNIIIRNYDGSKFTITDNRTTVCLPFNGTLSIVKN